MFYIPLLLCISISLSANENWIEIKPVEVTQTPKPNPKEDGNLSQVQPINKMIKKATIIKQLVDSINTKEKVPVDDKKWFVINNET